MNALKLSRCILAQYTLVFVFAVFLPQVQPSKNFKNDLPVTVLNAEPPVELTRLRFDLLDKYQRTARPLRNQKDILTIKIFYDIYHIVSLDEKYQTLTVNGKLKMFWTDEFLTWDPKSYSGITLIRFSPESIWWPQITVEYNSRPFTLYDKNRSPPITVYSNGSVEWFPTMRCAVPCSANYKHYPFDSHNCSIIILPRIYNDSGIAVTPYRPNGDESNMMHGGTEWTVTGIVHEAETSQEALSVLAYQQVRVRIFLERVSRIYRYICVIPTLISMVSLLFGFWLLPTETSRYVIGCSNVVVLSLLLQHMAATIPAGGVVPLIAQYSASCLCLSAVFIIVTVIVKIIRDCNGKAPTSALRLAHFRMDRWLCIFSFSHLPPEEDHGIPKDQSGRLIAGTPSLTPEEIQRRKDWCTVSVLADRIFFWCFAFIFVVLLSVLAAV